MKGHSQRVTEFLPLGQELIKLSQGMASRFRQLHCLALELELSVAQGDVDELFLDVFDEIYIHRQNYFDLIFPRHFCIALDIGTSLPREENSHTLLLDAAIILKSVVLRELVDCNKCFRQYHLLAI